MIPVIMRGDLTGRWYIVTRYTKKDGCIVAQTKYDCTDRINEIIAKFSPLTLEMVEKAVSQAREMLNDPYNDWTSKQREGGHAALDLFRVCLRKQMGGGQDA